MRAAPLAFLILASTFSGCLETKLIPAESDAAGAGAGEKNTGGSATGGDSSGGRSGASSGGSSGAGKGGGAATGGTVIATGGTRATGGAATTGGVHTGGAPTGGAAGSGGQSLPKVDWLTFDGSDAPSTSSPNGALGINGVLYAYTDGCAVLNWDAQTRCASGTLCNPNNGANWGIAVGFDFRNTGPNGAPPDTKLLWNPNDVGALGVAWQITGTAPGLQLWVLNMASVWNGQCSAASCDIAGPPDGDPGALLSDQLLFSEMRKDDWGGGGTPYQYDPAQVHALQFKLPAIVVGPVSFSFCVKSVGIVR